MASVIKNIKAVFGDVEMAPYTVVADHGSYEERLYPAKYWVCTKMEGPEYKPLIGDMFRHLFNHISGKNQSNTKIDMTTPVLTHVEPGAGPTCPSTFTMGFLIPEEHQENPPQPLLPEVFIEKRPTMHVLTRKFGGYVTDDIIAKEAEQLAEIIKDGGEKGVDFERYFVAGYDPPFKPMNRRNEIFFVKNVEGKRTDE